MARILPNEFYWFNRVNNGKFIPWRLNGEENRYQRLNQLFQDEHHQEREVESFGSRQDTDTYCGFEMINGVVQKNVIVFHPSWQGSAPSNIILSEHKNIFDFVRDCVLRDMENWVTDDNWKDYQT